MALCCVCGVGWNGTEQQPTTLLCWKMEGTDRANVFPWPALELWPPGVGFER